LVAGASHRLDNSSEVDLTESPVDKQEQDTLAAAAMRGDHAALAAIWQANRRWVAAVLLAYKPHHEDLEDLLQEVAMTLVSKVNTLRDQTNVRAWLRAVAINTARAAARTANSRPRPRLSLASVDGSDFHPEHRDRREFAGSIPPDEEAMRAVEMATRLPEAYREPLILKAVHGMRSRQISSILGIPEATVDTRVSRARKMLRELLRPAQAALAGGGDANFEAFRSNGQPRAAAMDHTS
jgi:RNA polymerase sigma-70 factor, ECF subfamily